METLIAASIVYMALENIVGVRVSRRWLITFGFGLVHGFGFSFALRETLQFAGSHLLTSLLAFNLGVELGQLLVLAIVVPMLALLFRYGVAERMGTIILSAFVAHTGWHWLTERGGQLLQFPVPALDLAALAALTLVAHPSRCRGRHRVVRICSVQASEIADRGSGIGDRAWLRFHLRDVRSTIADPRSRQASD